jgi:tRNA dimethylallyltransferase
MQVYRELRVLTARPTVEEEAGVPHRLYGVRPAAEAGSVAWWRGTALAAMDEARGAGRLPILTGGSGLYFAALTDGLADIPDPGPSARAEARRLLAEQGPAALHASLAHVDAATAARLHPEDSQRIARAWEVWRGTGMGLAAWQNRRSAPAPWRFSAIRLDPPREVLRAAIAARFETMLRNGAWRAGAVGLSGRNVVITGGGAADGAGHRSIHQAAGDMVSPSSTCTPDPHFYDRCAIYVFGAIFAK